MQADPHPVSSTHRAARPAWALAALGALVLAAGAAWWLGRGHDAPPPVAAPTQPAPTPATVPTPEIRHPVEQAPAAAEAAEPAVPLPALGDSDPYLFEALAGLMRDQGWRALLAGDFLIQRFVATIDNLPRRKLAPHLLPVRAAPGTLRVVSSGPRVTLDEANYARYDAYLQALEAVDTERVVQLYLRLYPLFQQAWREHGQAEGYFNDRLVEVIDHLLAAPSPGGPVELVRPKVFWEFADPALEQRSAGEKLMIRLGPAHAATVRTRLTAIRALLVAAPTAGD